GHPQLQGCNEGRLPDLANHREVLATPAATTRRASLPRLPLPAAWPLRFPLFRFRSDRTPMRSARAFVSPDVLQNFCESEIDLTTLHVPSHDLPPDLVA